MLRAGEVRALHWMGVALFLVLALVSGRAQADCPGTATPDWSRGQIVYYAFDPSIVDDQVPQIQRALSTWTSENSYNGSNVKFYPATSEHAPSLIFRNDT